MLSRSVEVRYFLSILLSTLILAQSCLATDTTYSSEFNLGNLIIEKAFSLRPEHAKPGEVEQKYAELLVEYLSHHYRGSLEIIKHPGKHDFPEYDVTFTNGYGFNISIDPACVEIQTHPATVQQIQDSEALVQKYIFDAGAAVGLLPRKSLLSGEYSAHLNMGARSAFEKDVSQFARFVTDYSNRPALASGVFGFDYYNAPPLRNLKEDQQKAYVQILEKLEAKPSTRLQDFADDVSTKVYSSSPGFPHGGGSSGRHYQAVGMKQFYAVNFPEVDAPFELRGIRQPQNAREFSLLVELMDKRVEYTRKRREPFYYRVGRQSSFSDLEKSAHFYIFMAEMDLDWRTYASLIPDKLVRLIESGETEKLIEGNINFEDPVEFQAFRDFMVENAYLSPFTEKKLEQVLLKPAVPEFAVRGILHAIQAQAFEGKGQSHWQYAYFERLEKSLPVKALLKARDDQVILPERTRAKAGWFDCSKAMMRKVLGL